MTGVVVVVVVLDVGGGAEVVEDVDTDDDVEESWLVDVAVVPVESPHADIAGSETLIATSSPTTRVEQRRSRPSQPIGHRRDTPTAFSRVRSPSPSSSDGPASNVHLDIVAVDFGVTADSEPGFVRPAVVVTAELVFQGRPRTIHAATSHAPVLAIGSARHGDTTATPNTWRRNVCVTLRA